MDARKSAEISTELSGSVDLSIECSQVNGSELPLFNFNFVAVATNNFSEENKLGQGGFGPVYKVYMYISSKCTKHFTKIKLKFSEKRN